MDFNEKSSRVKLLGLLVMFVVAMGGLATPAQADEPKGGDWQSVMDPSQWIEDPSYGPSKVSDSSSDSELVAAVADKVYRLGYSDGIARIVVDEDAKQVSVLWRGDVPADVRAYTDASPHDVKVVHKSGAEFSRKDVHRAVHAIQVSGLTKELDIVGLDPADDYSKITLKLRGSEKPSKATIDKIRKLTGLPVDYSLGHQAPLLFETAQASNDVWGAAEPEGDKPTVNSGGAFLPSFHGVAVAR